MNGRAFRTLSQARIPLLAAVLAAGPAAGQVQLTANTLELEEGAPPLAASLQDVAWLAGSWEGEALGGRVEEVWTPPSGGSMMGMFKLVQDGKVVFYELCTIQEIGGGLVLRLKHFNADLSGWEEKDEYVDFPLLRVEPDAMWFGGLTFRRDGPDRLIAHLALHGEDGSVREETFVYTRVRE